jgi:MFS family permease
MSSPSPSPLPVTAEPRLAGLAAVPEAPTLYTAAFVRLLAVQFCFGLSFSVYFLLPKYLTTQLHAGAAAIGAVGASALWASVLSTPLVAALLDRVGRRPALLLGTLITCLSSLAMPLAHAVDVTLFAIRIVQGVGFALVFNAASAATADLASGARLGEAIGMLGTASLISNALAPALAESAALTFGWSWVFIAAAVMSAVSFAIGLGVPETPRVPSDASAVIPRRGAKRITYAALLNGAAFATLFTFTQPHALDLGSVRVSGFFVGYTVAAVAVRLLFGNAADRLGRALVARYSFAFYAVVVCSMALLVPGYLELFGFAFGIAHGLLYPSLVALAAERSDPARRGAMLTLLNGAFYFGGGLILLGGGLVANATSYPALFLLVGVWMLVSVVSLPRSLARLD